MLSRCELFKPPYTKYDYLYILNTMIFYMEDILAELNEGISLDILQLVWLKWESIPHVVLIMIFIILVGLDTFIKTIKKKQW